MKSYFSTENLIVLVILLCWPSESFEQKKQENEFSSNPRLTTLPDKVREKILQIVNEDRSHHIPLNSSSSSSHKNCKDPSYNELIALFVDGLVKNLDMFDVWFISSSQMHRKSHMIPDLDSTGDTFNHSHNTKSSKNERSKYCKRLRLNEMSTLKWTSHGSHNSSPSTSSWSPLCPWEYISKLRHDRFPYRRWEAVCSCDYDCLSLNADSSTMTTSHFNSHSRHNQETSRGQCMQVKTPMPVLVRGECSSETNVYKWFFTHEDICTTCVCGRI